jgi:hypothetical protein
MPANYRGELERAANLCEVRASAAHCQAEAAACVYVPGLLERKPGFTIMTQNPNGSRLSGEANLVHTQRKKERHIPRA